MAETPLEQAAAAPRPRVVERLRAAPGAVALGTLAAIVVAYVATAAAIGGFEMLLDAEDPFHIQAEVRFDLVIALVLAFVLWTVLREPRATARDLTGLRPILDCSDAEHAALLQEALSAGHSVAAGLLGASLGLGVVLLTTWASPSGAVDPPPAHPLTASFRLASSIALNAGLFGLMGRLALASIRVSRLFAELGRRRVRLRLLDPGSLQPFARRGLRSASYWFIGSGIAMLLLVDAAVPGLIAAVIAGTLALGVVSLLLPSRGIHQQLREAKHAELARVRQLIERRSRELFEPEDAAAPDRQPPLPALLAWEARIESVREWPFDTPTLVRFALFLLIPLGSWLGGAVVERVVDLGLD
ncbi:MAG: hypothetical protein JRS35_02750 [Deltaproteobacteria bacterium]|nr:hypothetical protein [Deltaproteobacteria bacterium]